MLIGIIIVVASFVTLTLPVVSDLRAGSRLNGRGYIFIIAATIALGGGFWQVYQSYQNSKTASKDVASILKTIEREALRLSPDDFQLRAWVKTESPGALPGKYEPKPMYAHGTIGDATVMFQLLPLTPPEKVALRGRGITLLRYFAPTFTIAGLEKYPYIENLNGKSLRFIFPLYLGGEPVDYIDPHIELYIRGVKFDGSVQEDGYIVIPIRMPVEAVNEK